MTMIMGEDVRVAAARDSVLLGLRGRVVLETMHTVTIRTDSRRKVVLPKEGSALELSSGAVVLAEDLEGRLEDRIAVGARKRRTRA